MYNWPVWHRKFIFKKLKDHYDSLSGENDPDKYLVNEGSSNAKPRVPDAVQKAAANYNVKAPKPRK